MDLECDLMLTLIRTCSTNILHKKQVALLHSSVTRPPCQGLPRMVTDLYNAPKEPGGREAVDASGCGEALLKSRGDHCSRQVAWRSVPSHETQGAKHEAQVTCCTCTSQLEFVITLPALKPALIKRNTRYSQCTTMTCVSVAIRWMNIHSLVSYVS